MTFFGNTFSDYWTILWIPVVVYMVLNGILGLHITIINWGLTLYAAMGLFGLAGIAVQYLFGIIILLPVLVVAWLGRPEKE